MIPLGYTASVVNQLWASGLNYTSFHVYDCDVNIVWLLTPKSGLNLDYPCSSVILLGEYFFYQGSLKGITLGQGSRSKIRVSNQTNNNNNNNKRNSSLVQLDFWKLGRNFLDCGQKWDISPSGHFKICKWKGEEFLCFLTSTLITYQGAKLPSFRVSRTPKNTAGNPTFLQGFPTGHPVKIKAKLSKGSPPPFRKPEGVSETQVFGEGFRKETKFFFVISHPAYVGYRYSNLFPTRKHDIHNMF